MRFTISRIPSEGSVEEVLILTPSAVRFVALSATIGNARFLGDWFEQVAVHQRRRRADAPIQLHNHLAIVRRGQPWRYCRPTRRRTPFDESRRIDTW